MRRPVSWRSLPAGEAARWLALPAIIACAACGAPSGGSFANDRGGNDAGANGAGADASASGPSVCATCSDDGGPPPGFGTGGPVEAGSAAADGGTVQVTSIDRCTTGAPNGLSAPSVRSLLAGAAPGNLRLLYPYASTVFPRGLIAPTLMWDPSPADFVYVHLASKVFDYKGCLAPTASGQLLLPQDVWDAASAHTSGASDPFTLSVTLLSGGTVTGPISAPLVIAPATLKGSIYYNSYVSQLATGLPGGAVLRIVPGQKATAFLGQSGCTGCHAVAANGSRMVAATGLTSGSSYTLSAGVAPNPAPMSSNGANATFVGLSPDGSLYVTNAHPGLMGPRYPTTDNAGLFETDTGKAVNNSGIPSGAMMTSFSPDGKSLVFNDYAIGNGTGLATMAFNATARTASAYKKVYQTTGSSNLPGWPFFLPDDHGVIFAIGSSNDFSGGAAGVGVGTPAAIAPSSDLYVLDLAGGAAVILAQAMGFTTAANASSGTTYLPFGASDELHHNYYPTVSPVAAGGYFWIFFDSYRHYGNQGLVRQLWGTAVDVSSSGTYATDPSHPAFYVTGQESVAGNHRAFAALDPCHANGASCTSGVDCCGGFCTNGTCGIPPTPRCSNTDEMCGPGHPCCNTTEQCINGFCSIVVQ